MGNGQRVSQRVVSLSESISSASSFREGHGLPYSRSILVPKCPRCISRGMTETTSRQRLSLSIKSPFCYTSSILFPITHGIVPDKWFRVQWVHCTVYAQGIGRLASRNAHHSLGPLGVCHGPQGCGPITNTRFHESGAILVCLCRASWVQKYRRALNQTQSGQTAWRG